MKYDFETTHVAALRVAKLFDEFRLPDKAGLEVLALVVSDITVLPELGQTRKGLIKYFVNKLNEFVHEEIDLA